MLVLILLTIVITQGCATVEYIDPDSKKQVKMTTYLKEVHVGEITTPGGQTIVKDFESKNALKWLDTLIGGFKSAAEGVLGVRGTDIPIEINFPTKKDNEEN